MSRLPFHYHDHELALHHRQHAGTEMLAAYDREQAAV
jgi:hypothetical protein